MELLFELGPEFQKTVAQLNATGENIRAAVSEGLAEGVKAAAQHVSENYLTGQYLKSRTGNLRKAVQGWMADPLDGVVGVPEGHAVSHYMYQLGDETVTIRPKKAKYLVIPIGDNLSAAGVPKFDSPRDVPGGFFVKRDNQLLFGYRLGKTTRARFRPLFVLVKEVTIYGTGALYDGVEESLDKITDSINRKLNEKLN